ncbi:hypothetical protein ACFR9U_07060 [Halorientalis brevis]|uniref:Uncharacterized protein n=1 Tax=Halorientalis brevis TaxID=1126241 RepID=A0ABD6C8R5_9EURY|nr:hypothetical protein [Halorientalis brevis]
MSTAQQRPPVADAVLVVMQFGAALTALVLMLAVGIPLGTLEPLVFLTGFANLLIAVQVLLYFATLALTAVVAPRRTADRSQFRDSTTSSVWEYIPLSSILGAAQGAVLGALLVFAVPDHLSTVIPVGVLAGTAVAFVLAGNAVALRGVDTTLSTAGATIYAFVLSAVLLRPLGWQGMVVAAAVGMPALLAARWRLQAVGSIDRRVSVSLVLALLAVSGGTYAYDLGGPRPSVTLDTASSVNLSTTDERWYAVSDHAEKERLVSVGTVTVRNEFEFGRTARLPAYDACLYTGPSGSGPVGRASASIVDGGSMVSPADDPRLASGETREYTVALLLEHVDGLSTEQLRSLGTVPVRRADRCPESTNGPALVLAPADRLLGSD